MPDVEFRDIQGFEGIYQVGTDGTIRSLDRRMSNKDGKIQFFRGRVLRHSIHQDGYHCVNLQKHGKIKHMLVSRLVALAFIGSHVAQLEVNHKNGDKSNNSLSNLEAVTAKENCRHRDETGLRKPARGSSCGPSKLTETQVVEIVELLGSVKLDELAMRYGVSPSNISCIARGKTWSHITGIVRTDVKCSI